MQLLQMLAAARFHPDAPLQMLAYNVETVPFFVLLEPGGERMQLHPTAVRRPASDTAAKAPQLHCSGIHRGRQQNTAATDSQ
jgi:hypothetical protein